MKEKIFLQNDGMYCDYENRNAWFVERDSNILHRLCLGNMELYYEYNLNTGEESPYRRNPLCYKKGQTIVMFPDRGEKILFYDVEKKAVNECDVEGAGNIRIGMYCFGEFENLLWAVSYGMKQILLIDIGLKRIIKRYKLFRTMNHIEMGYESILNGGSIYCISRNSNYVSKTGIESGEEKIYELPVNESGFNTIHYDGERFWLSSMSGNIYLWDSSCNTIEQVCSLKKTMYRSIRVGDAICFLPLNLGGNLCDELFCCKIKGKSCFSYVINGQRKDGIYAFEYVRDNRYIGISHSNNNFITEIDTKNGNRSIVYINASEKYWKERRMDETRRYVQEGNILYENAECNLDFYLELMKRTSRI